MNKKQKFFDKFEDRFTNIIEKKERKRYYFNVKNKDIIEVADYLFNTMGCRLSICTATEVYDGLEVLYHFSDDSTGTIYNPRVKTSLENPEINSIVEVTKGAEWIEREMYDLFGIKFKGHPDPRKLLTINNPEFGEDDHPMRFKRDKNNRKK
ncbi:MAG: NADH-quinone oxidoreductase subunit C [Candidatus Cloacimonetes bacterium]|nr:NADH-quinone oxidoreductase subunit C [Candidatus Cloacimonadota bacterium]MBS3767217.1 NADH-quinone oxidoreductase subunit C [Candidatus Cloacimonadota bacterium]